MVCYEGEVDDQVSSLGFVGGSMAIVEAKQICKQLGWDLIFFCRGLGGGCIYGGGRLSSMQIVKEKGNRFFHMEVTLTPFIISLNNCVAKF